MKVSAGILAGIVALSVGHQASAAVLTATSTSGFFSDFTIEFDDSNGNGLFDFSERISFSRITLNPIENPTTYTEVLGLPRALDRFTFQAVSNPYIDPTFGIPLDQWEEMDSWLFGDGSGQTAQIMSVNFLVTLSGLSDPTVVPLPAGLPLLLAAFGALALLRRRQTVAA